MSINPPFFITHSYNETLLLIDEVQDASSGETLYFTLHYGDFDTGEVTRAEVIYP